MLEMIGVQLNEEHSSWFNVQIWQSQIFTCTYTLLWCILVSSETENDTHKYMAWMFAMP